MPRWHHEDKNGRQPGWPDTTVSCVRLGKRMSVRGFTRDTAANSLRFRIPNTVWEKTLWVERVADLISYLAFLG